MAETDFRAIGGQVAIAFPSLASGGVDPFAFLPRAQREDFFGDVDSIVLSDPDYNREGQNNGKQQIVQYMTSMATLAGSIVTKVNHPRLGAVQQVRGVKVCYECEMEGAGAAADASRISAQREVHYFEGKIVNNPTPTGDTGGSQPLTINFEIYEYARFGHYPDGAPAAIMPTDTALPDRSLSPMRYVSIGRPDNLTEKIPTDAIDYQGGSAVAYAENDNVFTYFLTGEFHRALGADGADNPMHHARHVRSGKILDLS